MFRSLMGLSCALLLWGCSPSVTFPVDQSGSATIEGGGLLGELSGFPVVGSFTDINFNENQEFKNQGVTKEQVSSVRLSFVKFKIQNPEDQDFSFLDSLEIVAKSGDQQALVASKQNIAALGLKAPRPELSLDLADIDLQPFVTAPTMSLLVRGKGRAPNRDTTLEVKLRLNVTAKLF